MGALDHHQTQETTEYRDLIVRAVHGYLSPAADEAALARIARDLAEGEAAKRILRGKGWGMAGTSIVDVANTVPRAGS
jgi:hypothetical protein